MSLIQFTNTNKYGTFRHRIIYHPGDKPFSHGRGFGPVVGIKAFKYTLLLFTVTGLRTRIRKISRVRILPLNFSENVVKMFSKK